MSDTGDWSDESNSGTPLPPALAAAVSLDNMMETGGDFEISRSIFGERPGSTVKKTKGNMARASRASATPTTSMSLHGTTPLSYASASSPAPHLGSLARATPTPAPCPMKAGSKFIQAVSERIEGFSKYGPQPSESEFALFAEEALRFVQLTLTSPALKDYTLPHGMCGSVSFETGLAMITSSRGGHYSYPHYVKGRTSSPS
jgi:hypothetical protein